MQNVLVGAAVLAVLTLLPPSAATQQQAASRPDAPSRSAAPDDAGFSSREADFVVGKRVFLRSTKTFIGVIRAADANHRFPPKRFPRGRMNAVLIERFDGPRDWVPVEGIGRIYAVR